MSVFDDVTNFVGDLWGGEEAQRVPDSPGVTQGLYTPNQNAGVWGAQGDSFVRQYKDDASNQTAYGQKLTPEQVNQDAERAWGQQWKPSAR